MRTHFWVCKRDSAEATTGSQRPSDCRVCVQHAAKLAAHTASNPLSHAPTVILSPRTHPILPAPLPQKKPAKQALSGDAAGPHRARPMASISSMKIMEGAWLRACSYSDPGTGGRTWGWEKVRLAANTGRHGRGRAGVARTLEPAWPASRGLSSRGAPPGAGACALPVLFFNPAAPALRMVARMTCALALASGLHRD
jgi:hypothetical protein